MSDPTELQKLNSKIADVKATLAELEAAATALHNNQQHELIDKLQSLDDAEYQQAVQCISQRLHDELHHFTDKLRSLFHH